jgi:hypothetical protein
MCAASPHRGIRLHTVSTARPKVPRNGCVPTYCAAVWSAHHIVLVELEVLVEDGRVELHLAVELVAHLFPVGGWLRHGDGYPAIMARYLSTPCYRCRCEVMSRCTGRTGRSGPMR